MNMHYIRTQVYVIQLLCKNLRREALHHSFVT